MKHEVKVVARTYEVGENHNTAQMNKDLTLLSGKAAGVCYMPDDYMENGIQNEESALKRAKFNSKNGHHSVFEHGHISFVVKTNKMMCMILNSLGVYSTSEKSARYTVMKPETDLELELYNKWIGKLKTKILETYPDIDDATLSTRLCKKLGIENSKAVINGQCYHIKDDEFLENELKELKKSLTLPSYKLAQENARYMISVFTPTTMMYTVSFREACLIIDYLIKLINNCARREDKFTKKICSSAYELMMAIREAIGEQQIHDNKNQHIRFLEAQHVGEDLSDKFVDYEDLEERFKAKKEVLGDSYTLVYNGSLAMLAQAQRHRTIRYTMFIDEVGEFGYYVPPIIRNTELEKEWLEDIQSVSYCVPQGTMVRITEQGIFEDLILKCKERLCGRAQLEIMLSTLHNLEKFTDTDNFNNLCYSNKKLLESVTVKDKESGKLTVVPRCRFTDFKCTEGCDWGAKDAFNRLI